MKRKELWYNHRDFIGFDIKERQAMIKLVVSDIDGTLLPYGENKL